MNNLNANITTIKGIGPKKAALFNRIGIYTVDDLLHTFPRKYEDRSVILPISSLSSEKAACILCQISSSPTIFSTKNNIRVVKYEACDHTGSITLLFFNMRYIDPRLSFGKKFFMYGTVHKEKNKCYMNNPIFEEEGSEKLFTRRIVPIYKLTKSLSNREFCRAVKSCYEENAEAINEYIPADIVKKYKLCSASEAVRNLHFPESMSALAAAKYRVTFCELFKLFCLQKYLRNRIHISSNVIATPLELEDFYQALPFPLTNSQKGVIQEIYKDLLSGKGMTRLVQGDVGSGKTIVAAAAIWLICKSGYSCLLMAPTEILSVQHYHKLKNLLEKFNIPVYLLTGSTRPSEREKIRSGIQDNPSYLLIGTHALLNDSYHYANLGLVVTDEQHRFGVEQRAALIAKGIHPHVLIMSATPIPRTLAMAIYGELDISTITELPPGRKPVSTYIVDDRYRERLLRFIGRIIEKGQQVYIVCSRIGNDLDIIPVDELDNNQDIKTVFEIMDELTDRFPQYKIEYLHGKLSSTEKNTIMHGFVSGDINILVSTTVIEVGVDIPNATLMLIENAELFGLAQLHQLRGRIGRGDKESYCILITNTKSPDSIRRLKVLVNNYDGMKISEEDLKFRGPGDFFGNRQHGLPALNLVTDSLSSLTLQSAKNAAELIMARDPDLEDAENYNLKIQIEKLKSRKQLSLSNNKAPQC